MVQEECSLIWARRSSEGLHCSLSEIWSPGDGRRDSGDGSDDVVDEIETEDDAGRAEGRGRGTGCLLGEKTNVDIMLFWDMGLGLGAVVAFSNTFPVLLCLLIIRVTFPGFLSLLALPKY